ncbi:hypothetical protein [Paraburkholderia ginsengisoli]|uniref:Transmembrane protein n=1 Tax=Paraburkholderia ginsengisoli TaxID=311231 RepID=A0A7T4T8M8_9BURK|nr:hypothetical protein [Paraburkholderia ginsengisoli]QQC63844.1 hypothetical protein I6I06_16385 [Paraburkholderia ginsengisoli]
MSTILLTPVEGAIAMPRLRPLDRLPAPFGRDWALLAPGHSWRTEIKALYAAVLRTFCMSDKAILSFCKWVPLNARRAAAAVAAAATDKRATVFRPPVEAAPQVLVEAAAAPVIEGPVFVSMSRGPRPHWGALAGGACALSGAAMLAWIAFGHLMHRQTHDTVTSADTVTANRNEPEAQRLARDVVGARGPVAGDVKTRTRSTASAREESPSISAAGYARSSTSTKATAASRVSGNDTVAHRRHALRDTNDSAHEKNRRHVARSTPGHPLSYVAAMANEMPRSAVPPAAQRTSPKPSTAGRYSPLAPSQLGTDEYADVTMFAATHLRDIAPPSRPASSNHAPAGNGTEWMNHMSQRRVTEVPDQFAK